MSPSTRAPSSRSATTPPISDLTFGADVFVRLASGVAATTSPSQTAANSMRVCSSSATAHDPIGQQRRPGASSTRAAQQTWRRSWTSSTDPVFQGGIDSSSAIFAGGTRNLSCTGTDDLVSGQQNVASSDHGGRHPILDADGHAEHQLYVAQPAARMSSACRRYHAAPRLSSTTVKKTAASKTCWRTARTAGADVLDSGDTQEPKAAASPSSSTIKLRRHPEA